MLEAISNIIEHPLCKLIFTWIAISLWYLFGDFTFVFQAVVFAVLLDFTLGFSIAIYEWKFCKEKFLGWLKKEVTFAVAIIIWHLADIMIFHSEVEWWVQNFFLVYIGINELISSLKHLSKLGFRTPEKLLQRLESQKETLKF